ncbi:Zinc ion binding [Dermatophagoides farinae]|uniref:Zinc ion binding n=1 Tax=Dermatophagoides farinae TaxID=6954 RepID=A0A922I968_DERFA|nr:Zinc ion binding [Dermatophagoides farinae]
MDETKERLKQLIDFFTGHYLTWLNQQQASNNNININNNNDQQQQEQQSAFDPDQIKAFIDDISSSSNIVQNDDEQSSQPQSSWTFMTNASSSSTTRSDTQSSGAIGVKDGNTGAIQQTNPPISRQDLETLIKTMELCKKNMTHFATSERLYLMPLMTLCGHVLLTETHLISRTYLSIVSEILVYILQFSLNEISLYNDEENNYIEFNVQYLQQMKNVDEMNVDTDEYYRHFLKYRLIRFLSFLLLDDNNHLKETSNALTQQDLICLCQMLRMKSMPDTLRLHSSVMNVDSETSSLTADMIQSSSVKRIRLTQSLLERNSKEEFFDQLLTPFIFSNTAANHPTDLHNISSSSIPLNQQTPVKTSMTTSATAAAAAATIIAPTSLSSTTVVAEPFSKQSNINSIYTILSD